MIQEKKTLQTVTPAGEYTAPSVKVKELRNRRVLCASGEESTITSLTNDDEQGGW